MHIFFKLAAICRVRQQSYLSFALFFSLTCSEHLISVKICNLLFKPQLKIVPHLRLFSKTKNTENDVPTKMVLKHELVVIRHVEYHCFLTKVLSKDIQRNIFSQRTILSKKHKKSFAFFFLITLVVCFDFVDDYNVITNQIKLVSLLTVLHRSIRSNTKMQTAESSNPYEKKFLIRINKY